MAIQFSDPDGHISKLWGSNPSEREQRWLWLRLKHFAYFVPTAFWQMQGTPSFVVPSIDIAITTGGIESELLQLLEKYKSTIPKFRASRCFTQDIDFDWVTDDVRQLNWLINSLHSALNFEITDARARFSDREYFICLIDLVMLPIADKRTYLLQQQQSWARHLRNTSYLNWLGDNVDPERNAFSWKILESRIILAPMVSQWSNPDIWKQKGGMGLKCYFDTLQISDYEKKSHIDHIRKLWSQRKYREKLEKNKVRQRNFVLSDTTMADLDKLAKKLGTSRTEALERLIEMTTRYGLPGAQATPNTSTSFPVESS